MLTQHHRSVFLSLVSTDMPVWSVINTAATLYQKDHDRFHLLLVEPQVVDPFQQEPQAIEEQHQSKAQASLLSEAPRLIWLEISPYRVIMTMQGNGKLSYRHFWEKGVYGLSRFWLQNDSPKGNWQLRLRNFTRLLKQQGKPVPDHLRVEYELWSNKVQLGQYVLNLDIQH